MKTIFGAGLAVVLAVFQLPAQTALNAGNLPLSFEANRGQADATAPFIAHGQNSEFLLSATGAQLVLRNSSGQTATTRMQFAGANPSARISGDAALPGKVNYFIGNQPVQWQSGVPTFAKVCVDNLYPGVNVVYYGNGRQLEYDFNLAPGIDPQTIAIHFDGAEKISVNPQGELVVSLNGGEIIQHSPLAYQNVGAIRHEIAGSYKILDAHTATFAVDSYDYNLPLVIDPILSYSTYFGGNGSDIAHAIAVDTNGCIYIAGETLSTLFTKVSAGGFQTNFHGGSVVGDAFVAKFDNTGRTNLYFTYLGGSDNDAAYGLAVDGSGNAFITGGTESADFPTNHPLFGRIGGQPLSQGFYLPDVFVAELNPTGSALLYSTYLGGSSQDIGKAIAVDVAGNAYVTGYTSSTNFPVTTNALQNKLLCPSILAYNNNAFVTEISAYGTNLNYSSYLGGTNYDQASGIAVDPNGFVYVTGFTASTNFPTTNALAGFQYLNGSTNAIPFNTTPSYDAFVCKFQPGLSNWVYSTFLGGTNSDAATGIAADGSGNAYVVGWTTSTNLVAILTNNFPGAYAGFIANGLTNNTAVGYSITTNSFLAEINSSGTALRHVAVFGGVEQGLASSDQASGVALDAAGDIFVVGSTTSTNFPVTAASLVGSLHATNASAGYFGYSDVFVTVFKADWTGLLYSTYLGGALNDFGNAIATDGAGNAYVAGQTFSTDFPSFNAYQPALNSSSALYGTSDAFLAKILPAAPTPLLTAAASGTNVLVSWQPAGEESPVYFGLQTTTNLLTTNGWTAVTNSPAVTNNNGSYTYQINPTNPAQFFRLHKF